MDLIQKMQGAIHAADAREQAGFSGGIHWRTVVPWLRQVEELEAELRRTRQMLAIAEIGEDPLLEA